MAAPSSCGADPEADPANWGVTIRQLQHFYDDIRDDMIQYCRDHQILTDFSHLCLENGECPHQHLNAHNSPLAGASPEQLRSATKLTGTMHLVVARYIKPRTQPHGCSYAVMLNRGSLKRATKFISHSWGERFGDFVLSIGKALTADDVAWICSFALAQNSDITEQLGTNLEESPFARALVQADTVLLMVDANVEPLTRVWCVFELHLAARSGKHIEMWSASFTASMLQKIERRAADLDVRNCLASNPEDLKKIMDCIKGSEDKVNEKVRQLARLNHRIAMATLEALGMPGGAGGGSGSGEDVLDTNSSRRGLDDRLLDAVRNGDAKMVRSVLQAGAIAQPALLAEAAARNDAAVACALFAAGASWESAKALLRQQGNDIGDAVRAVSDTWSAEQRLRRDLGDVVAVPFIAKLTLLGAGRAGKTSLVKALSGKPFDVEENTTLGCAMLSLAVQPLTSATGWHAADVTSVFDDEVTRLAAAPDSIAGDVATSAGVVSDGGRGVLMTPGRIRPDRKGSKSSTADGPMAGDAVNRICHEFVVQRGGGGQSVRFEIFDFGGQDCYRQIHQLFITDRSFHIVVTNLSLWCADDEAMRVGASELRFWLTSVRCHAPSSPWLVVATHIDRLTQADLQAATPRLNKAVEEFLAAAGDAMEESRVAAEGSEDLFFPVDNSRTVRVHGVDVLRSAIEVATRQAVEARTLGQEMPLRWLRVASSLRARQSTSAVKMVAKEKGVITDDDELPQLLAAMRTIGRVVWFEEASMPPLGDQVVDPGWFVTSFGRLLNFARTDFYAHGASARAVRDLRDCGIVSDKLCDAAWRDEEPEVRKWLLEAMWAFGLVLRIHDRAYLPDLVPRLSEEERRATSWQPPENALVVTFAERVWPTDSASGFGLPLAAVVFPAVVARLTKDDGVQVREHYRDALWFDRAGMGGLRIIATSPETIVAWVTAGTDGAEGGAEAPVGDDAARAAAHYTFVVAVVRSVLDDRLACAPATIGPPCLGRPYHAQPLDELTREGGSSFATCICNRRTPKASAPGWVTCWTIPADAAGAALSATLSLRRQRSGQLVRGAMQTPAAALKALAEYRRRVELQTSEVALASYALEDGIVEESIVRRVERLTPTKGEEEVEDVEMFADLFAY